MPAITPLGALRPSAAVCERTAPVINSAQLLRPNRDSEQSAGGANAGRAQVQHGPHSLERAVGGGRRANSAAHRDAVWRARVSHAALSSVDCVVAVALAAAREHADRQLGAGLADWAAGRSCRAAGAPPCHCSIASVRLWAASACDLARGHVLEAGAATAAPRQFSNVPGLEHCSRAPGRVRSPAQLPGRPERSGVV